MTDAAPSPSSSGIDEAFRKWCYEKPTPPLGLMTPRAGAMEAFKAGIEYARTSSPTPQPSADYIASLIRGHIKIEGKTNGLVIRISGYLESAHAVLAATSPQVQAGETDDLLERLDDQGLYSKAERIQMIKDAAAEIRRLRGVAQAPIVVTDEMVESGLAAWMICESGPTRRIVRTILDGALSSVPSTDGGPTA